MVMKNRGGAKPPSSIPATDTTLTKVDSLGRKMPMYRSNRMPPVLPGNMAVANKLGTVYTPTVPLPNIKGYGQDWEWTEEKCLAAELIAEGHSQRETADLIGMSDKTVRDWLRVPSFCQRIDDIVMEEGLATKRIRIAKMQRMATRLEEVFYRKAEQLMIDPTMERLKDIAQEFREYAKQIAVEKEEYAEVTKVQVTGEIGLNTSIKKVEGYLGSLSDEERKAMEAEFAQVADNVIAEYVHGLPTAVVTEVTTPEKQGE